MPACWLQAFQTLADSKEEPTKKSVARKNSYNQAGSVRLREHGAETVKGGGEKAFWPLTPVDAGRGKKNQMQKEKERTTGSKRTIEVLDYAIKPHKRGGKARGVGGKRENVAPGVKEKEMSNCAALDTEYCEDTSREGRSRKTTLKSNYIEKEPSGNGGFPPQ